MTQKLTKKAHKLMLRKTNGKFFLMFYKTLKKIYKTLKKIYKTLKKIYKTLKKIYKILINLIN
jgi:hypothetical protein